MEDNDDTMQQTDTTKDALKDHKSLMAFMDHT